MRKSGQLVSEDSRWKVTLAACVGAGGLCVAMLESEDRGNES